MHKKINALEGPWLDDFYLTSVRAKLEEAGLPISRQGILPLLNLHSNSYWGGLRSYPNFEIAVLDPRHWYFEDSVFEDYINRCATVRFPAFVVAESPFGCDKPPLETPGFIKKLIERTNFAVEVIKNAHPNTLFLSPAIGIVDEKDEQYIIDFFIETRQLFDAYTVHCCGELREHDVGRIGSLLTQIMKILRKPVWITKWGISCFEGRFFPAQNLMGGWEPLKYGIAVQRLRRSFSVIESAVDESIWFYVGLGQDLYKPGRQLGIEEFWQPFLAPLRQEISNSWSSHHFMGIATYEQKIKNPVLNTLIQFAKEYNE